MPWQKNCKINKVKTFRQNDRHWNDLGHKSLLQALPLNKYPSRDDNADEKDNLEFFLLQKEHPLQAQSDYCPVFLISTPSHHLE